MNILVCEEINNWEKSKKEYLISVYSFDGVFQYAYKTEAYGRVRAKWNGNNILVLWVRSDVVKEVQPDGKIISSGRFDSDDSTQFKELTKRIVGNYRFEYKWCGLDSLANYKIVSISKQGEEKIIFKTNYHINYLMVLIVVGILYLGILCMIIYYYLSRSRSHDMK